MATSLRFSLVLLFICFRLALSDSVAASVAVNYGRIADNLPPPSQVAQLLKSHGLTKAKLFDTDSSVLSAFSTAGISFVVSLPNQLLSSAAAPNTSFTDNWVQSNILPYKQIIEAIAVGNEVFVDPQNTTQFLVPAMNNIHSSLVKLGLDTSIKISSPIALSALASSYPSSSGSFKPELIESVIKPMLSFLKQTNSSLMVNVYPFFAYKDNSNTISLDYALFKDNAGVVDSGNGLRYKSLFDAQIDAVYAAMDALQFNDVKIVVSETGWPSKGDENETGAGKENAAAYIGNLVRRVLTGGGSPRRPNEPLNVYLFALFNEDQKNGPISERNYGLFYPNKERVYDVPLTLAELKGQSNANGSTTSKTQIPAPAAAPTSSGETWCVANVNVGEKKLQEALDYACGEGGADCSVIEEGAACFNPNTTEAHASYAFNSYYQLKSRATGTCDFGGAGYLVTQPPRFGKCEFPTRY
ncbi:glucan endo-1,3-beta-glucosidase 13-like [Impatiens glandulifera]|uniref:glucan endo-1,3-beta-glucosidase 13-like n=1 Tax=Impatiens glandulifera TaxID=253017 RepID=UPI001FB19E6F|nr:glucan endo-1,3-beta-glucosidase 13-like [Impatiens glandulifera]